MVSSTTTLGGPAASISVGKIGHGLMRMTWQIPALSDEQTFAAIKSGIDSLPPNTKMMLNSAEFYGRPNGLANLELVSRFFERYPEYAERAFLVVKGGMHPGLGRLQPDGSPANIRRSVETCLGALRGMKKIDAFECARVDPNVPYEESIKCLGELVKEGKIDYVSVSETSAATLRRAHAVHPIVSVEIEVSPWSYEEETVKVIKAAKEIGAVVLAYSPLGRGFLTGEIKTIDDLAPDDPRRMSPRFQPENIAKNVELVHALEKIAAKKDVTLAQLSLAWVASRGPHVIPIPGSSSAKRSLENQGGGNVVLAAGEIKELDDIVASFEVSGHRYPEAFQSVLWG